MKSDLDIMGLVTRVETLLKRKFQDYALFHTSLTHRSYANENNISFEESNERLEFLGDAVLGLLVGELLMQKYPASQEGELSKMRSLVVNEKSLAVLARQLDLGRYLYLGKGEMTTQGGDKDSILADAFEAVIAAIYLSLGLEDTRAFVVHYFSELLDLSSQDPKDYKTLLQEFTQRKLKASPKYVLLRSFGPDHDKTFETEVRVQGKPFGRGEGKTKKESEQEAAKGTLALLQAEPGEE